MALTLIPLRPARAQYPGGGGYPGSGADTYGYPAGNPNGPYSGGTLVLHNGDGSTNTEFYYIGPNNGPPGFYGDDYYASAGANQTCTATASGTIYYTFTWNGGTNNDPPPPAVIKTETCTVEYSAPDGSGSDANPLAGQGATPPSPPGTAWTCTQYTPINNPPATINDSLSGATATASATAPANYYANAWAGVYDSVSYSPVSIQLTGPVKDSSKNWDIMIGQHCTAQIAGIPQALLNTATYQWAVSGETFQTWSPTTSGNPDASYYVDGFGPSTNPTAGWYWHDPASGKGNSKTETVICMMTLTPPGGSPFTLTVTQPVNVYTPAWTGTGVPTTMSVSIDPYAGGSGIWLWAGTPGPPGTPGMTWNATVAPPVPNPANFGAGSLYLAQLITPGASWVAPWLGFPHTYYDNDYGQLGLDGNYPYAGGWYVGAPNYQDYDVPGINLTGYNATSATLQDQFFNYLMYSPAGSGQVVPLASFVWSTNGSATEPPNGWAAYTGSAGSVIGGVFQPNSQFPMWTQIDTP